MFSRLIYSLVLTVAAPFVWLWLYWRARDAFAAWQPWAAERFGRYPQPWDGSAPIWVHAASVGETRACKPLIQALVLAGHTVILTHLTPTGRAEGQRVLADEIGRGRVRQQWIAYDWAFAARGFIKHYAPRMLVLIEREVWPNLVHQCALHSTPVVLASARLSAKSLAQIRWMNRLFGGLLHDAYAEINAAYAQSQLDAQRLFEAGVPAVTVVGNLKFDVTLPHVAIEAARLWRAQLQRPTLVIASTREGEDKPFVQQLGSVVHAHGQAADPTHKRPLYILVPRHPQRFEEVATLLSEQQLRFVRWSHLRGKPQSQAELADVDVVLGDTMGEMPFFYAAADIAIVAGSFEPHGGQNFIEACAVGTPVIVGPHTRNFSQAVASALDAKAIVQVQTMAQAFKQVNEWQQHPDEAAQMGQIGASWVTTHVGATERILQAMHEMLEQTKAR
jgi:3-deoxy-D-manno-octulosonic-acid transferase